jgi:hypothetical protein
MTRERQRLRILYEDRIGAVRDFPLHRLVIAAAHDLCEQFERWRLEQRVIAIPKNGQGSVMNEVTRAPIHRDDGVCLLAWLDDDHVRDLFPDGSRLTRAVVIERVKERAGTIGPGRLEVFLLDKNLESLLEALEPELRDSLGEEVVTKAIRKKRLDSRDQLLLHIANSSRLRELLRRRHRGFDCVARYVALIATVEPWPFHGAAVDG